MQILDMRDALGITDFFVNASGRNERHVRRIKEAVEERMRELGVKPARRAGERFAHWILIDYIDFVVHVFLTEERSFYNLERLWKDVPVIEWREEAEANTTSDAT